MPRLTKSDIERRLLTGTSVTWKDSKGKSSELVLGEPKARRLFAFLLGTKTRDPTGLSQSFIDGLSSTYFATDDPSANLSARTTPAANDEPWRLQSIDTEGFGGLNVWAGPPFHFEFDQQSLLIE